MLRIAVAFAIPPAAALAALHADPVVAHAARRPGILALGMFTMAAAMLSARLRRWLLVALAYGAAILAFEGTFLRPPGGAEATFGARGLGWLSALYPSAWVLLLVLAGFAGTLEALRPGTILAKRCLFAAAAVYLFGHGAAGMLDRPNSISAFTLLVGVGSLLGAMFVHRFSATPPPAIENGIPSAQALAAERRRRLAEIEWRDPARER
ncbi:MAG: hypothetical protein FJX72_14395 [Armatimonadetes bacterium]|nr:hypothetical protein [Armatimonadota bacterium]